MLHDITLFNESNFPNISKTLSLDRISKFCFCRSVNNGLFVDFFFMGTAIETMKFKTSFVLFRIAIGGTLV